MKLSFLPIAPLVLFLLSSSFSLAFAGNVTYDHRSLIINGQRKLLISASIHCPGSLPAMWPGKVQTAKEGGVDVIETHVFWNGHELSPGNYYCDGRFNLVKFVKIVQQAGLFLILQIGPFVATEWNYRYVRRSWFKPSGNVLVIFEENGGDPTKISFLRRKVSGACALVAEDHPSLGLDLEGEDKLEDYKNTPFARLACPKDSHISSIKFASFGTPSGTCGSNQIGGCHDPNSSLLVEKACLNKKECVIKLNEENFKNNLCSGLTEKLPVGAVCS